MFYYIPFDPGKYKERITITLIFRNQFNLAESKKEKADIN